MKRLLFTFLTLVLLNNSSCRKHKPSNPIDQLPPETQTGAKTFGCLVNGEAFKPGGASLSGGSYQCNYQYLGTGANGGHYLIIAGRYQNNSQGGGSSVGLFTDSLKVHEGNKYSLKGWNTKGVAYAGYSSYTNAYNSYQTYDTDGSAYTGELWIKKLDTVNQIVSGTFWFDAVNANGEKVEVREGRFDMHYTR